MDKMVELLRRAANAGVESWPVLADEMELRCWGYSGVFVMLSLGGLLILLWPARRTASHINNLEKLNKDDYSLARANAIQDSMGWFVCLFISGFAFLLIGCIGAFYWVAHALSPHLTLLETIF